MIQRLLLCCSLLLLACGGEPEPAETTAAAASEAPAAPAPAPDTPAPPKVVKPINAPPVTPLQPSTPPAGGDVPLDQPAEPAGPAAASGDKPISVDGITGLLLARHAEDLPSKGTLDKHSEAPAALRWIAGNDDRLIVVARALELLAHYPEPTNRALLLSTATSTAHPKARAAAWRALAAFDVPNDAELKAAAESASQDPAKPVALAAQAALEK